MITQQSNSNVGSNPNKWLQSSMARNHRKLKNITIKNGNGKTTLQ